MHGEGVWVRGEGREEWKLGWESMFTCSCNYKVWCDCSTMYGQGAVLAPAANFPCEFCNSVFPPINLIQTAYLSTFLIYYYLTSFPGLNIADHVSELACHIHCVYLCRALWSECTTLALTSNCWSWEEEQPMPTSFGECTWEMEERVGRWGGTRINPLPLMVPVCTQRLYMH